MEYKLYEVGGHVRDSLLQIPSNDIDYTVVVHRPLSMSPVDAFRIFVHDIKKKGYDVFLETESCLTVRAKRPNSKIVADFVIARKEDYPDKHSRTPVTSLGTLADDLARRDFTVNCIARGEDGEIIDFFSGVRDLRNNILRTPVETLKSFNDDPLRIIRAIRFHVTRGFDLSDGILNCIRFYPIDRMSLISEERIREELFKCFHHDTAKTLNVLIKFKELGFNLLDYVFDNTNIWLEPTNKK